MPSRAEILKTYVDILNNTLPKTDPLPNNTLNLSSDDELFNQLKITYKKFEEIKCTIPPSKIKDVSYDNSVTLSTICFFEFYKSEQKSDGAVILQPIQLQILGLIIGTHITKKINYEVTASLLQLEHTIKCSSGENVTDKLLAYHPRITVLGEKNLEPKADNCPRPEPTTNGANQNKSHQYQPPLPLDDSSKPTPAAAPTTNKPQKAACKLDTTNQKKPTIRGQQTNSSSHAYQSLQAEAPGRFFTSLGRGHTVSLATEPTKPTGNHDSTQYSGRYQGRGFDSSLCELLL